MIKYPLPLLVLNQNGADTFGLELLRVYEDPALSGSLQPLERPGLLALLEVLKAGELEKFIVSRLDRLSRDTMLCLARFIRRGMNCSKDIQMHLTSSRHGIVYIISGCQPS